MIARLPVPLLIVSLAGCVMHAPVSEMALFSRSEADRFGVGLSGSVAATSQGNALAEAKRRFANPNRSLSSQNTGQRAAGFYLGSYGKTTALALTLGFPVLGLDFTYRPVEKTALTAGVSIRGGVQAVVQHRILHRRNVAGSLGISVRRELIWIDDDQIGDCDAFLGCSTSRSIAVTSAGLRAVTVLSDHASRGLYGHVYAGYAPDLDQAVVSFGISLGGF